MSYYNQLSNQAQGFANYGQLEGQALARGQERINDYNIEKQEYTGAEVAHRNGIQALKTGNEMPRLMEEYFGLKPAAKKIVPALLEKSGLTSKFKSAIEGTRFEGLLKKAQTAKANVEGGMKAMKEGRYGDVADAMTGGKASEAAGTMKKFAQDTLDHHTQAFKDAKGSVDGWTGNKGSEVRQIGSDAYNKLSAEAKGALPKGAVDEDNLPLNPSEFSRADTYKGLTTGRLKYGEDGKISDTLNDASVDTPGIGQEGLLGGGRLSVGEGGQLSFSTESGDPYGVGSSGDGGMRVGSQAYRDFQDKDLGSEMRGNAQTQANLDRMTAEQDAAKGSVDFGRQTGRTVDPAQTETRAQQVAGKRPANEPVERASPEDVAESRIPKEIPRSGQRVRIRQPNDGGGGAAEEDIPGVPDSGLVGRIQQKIRDGAARGERQTDSGLSENTQAVARDEAAAAARSTTTEGGFYDQLAPMRGAARATEGEATQATGRATEGAAARTEGAAAEEGSYAARAAAGGATRGAEAPALSRAPALSQEAKAARQTDSGLSETTQGAARDDISTAISKGAERKELEGTFAKTAAKAEAETAPAEEAEAAVPGIGEVLMGITAIGGLIKGAIAEHKEKKAMEADAPVAPTAPTAAQQTAGQPHSGIGFNVAPVLDSDDYHHQ